MRAILAAVAMLQALITGDCLLCEQCLAISTTQCSGIFKQCSPDVTHCIKGLENSTVGSDFILTAFKDCLDPSQKATCGRESSIQTSISSLSISRTCCDSDFCNGGDIRVPAVDETPNGYKCESCFTTQSEDTCTAAGEVQCHGERNTCVRFAGTASRPGDTVKHYISRGCVEQDFCQLFYMVGTQFFTYDLQCSPAKKL